MRSEAYWLVLVFLYHLAWRFHIEVGVDEWVLWSMEFTRCDGCVRSLDYLRASSYANGMKEQSNCDNSFPLPRVTRNEATFDEVQ